GPVNSLSIHKGPVHRSSIVYLALASCMDKHSAMPAGNCNLLEDNVILRKAANRVYSGLQGVSDSRVPVKQNEADARKELMGLEREQGRPIRRLASPALNALNGRGQQATAFQQILSGAPIMLTSRDVKMATLEPPIGHGWTLGSWAAV